MRQEALFHQEMCKSVSYLQKQINTPIQYNRDVKYFIGNQWSHSLKYDCEIRFYPSKIIAMELKICHTPKIYFKQLFSNGREKEIQELLRQEQFGFQGWVLINHYKERAYNLCYAVRPEIAMLNFVKGGSLLPEELNKIDIKRIKNEFGFYIWDLLPLI